MDQARVHVWAAPKPELVERKELRGGLSQDESLRWSAAPEAKRMEFHRRAAPRPTWRRRPSRVPFTDYGRS